MAKDLYFNSKFSPKAGEYTLLESNKADCSISLFFSSCRFHVHEKGLFVGMRVDSINGLNIKSVIEYPTNLMFNLSTVPYEYTSGFGENKKTETIDPTPRERLLYQFLMDSEGKFFHEKVTGQSGYIAFSDTKDDLTALDGKANLKVYCKSVLSFDGEGSGEFDMTGDNFRLDLQVKGGSSGSKGGGVKAEPESDKIKARQEAIKAILIDVTGKETMDLSGLTQSQLNTFITLSSFALGLPLPSFPTSDFF
jgi:hypothetical protein